MLAFSKETYINRRNILKQKVKSGMIVLFGNNNVPVNYPNNSYKYRQDSSFLYYFGQQREGLIGIIDIDNDCEYLLGDDININDIIWTGYVPSVKELAEEIGVHKTAPINKLGDIIKNHLPISESSPTLHFLPQYRHDIMILLGDVLNVHPLKVNDMASVTLIKSVVDMRAVKSSEEIEEIERALSIGYEMHTTAMKLCRPGVSERYIAGVLSGIAESKGCMESFQTILTMHGEIFHGNPSDAPLEAGRLMLCDAGAETINNYCSDHTRVTPISGKFTSRQRDIYSIVEQCHDLVISLAKPEKKWIDIHLDVCRHMVSCLKDIGLMKGNVDNAVEAGAHALFFPHGLGHMLGMDVHDMEGFGQVHVGFDEDVRPSDQFGTNNLRCGRRIKSGWVLTDEPGIYFIPILINQWKGEKKHQEFICYDKIDNYYDFGGIRIEDDILITDSGCRMLGNKIIPYHISDVEDYINQ